MTAHVISQAALTITQAVEVARNCFAAANPNSRALFEQATHVMPGGNTRSVLYYEPFPLSIASGQGCYLTDADGHEYLDMIGEFTAGVYGHSNPVIRQAIIEAMDGGINLTGHNLYEARLAELICQRFALDGVRFTNSGTEANLMALVAAQGFTGRRRVMVFNGGYHGGVLGFGNGPSPVNVPHDFLYATYNDSDSVEQLLRENQEEVAAILVEPMQGASGGVVGHVDFLKALRRLATQHGCVLIFDEVMTSRLAPNGLQSVVDVKPDMTVLGKYIGGGMTFGAFGGSRALMAQFDPRHQSALPHSGTFNNNVMTMAAGIAGLTSLYTAEAATTLNAKGSQLCQRLNHLAQREMVTMQFSGYGSVMNVQFVAGDIVTVDDLREQDERLKALFFFHLLERGIYIARRGLIVLSLPVTEREIARFESAVEGFIERYKTLINTPCRSE